MADVPALLSAASARRTERGGMLPPLIYAGAIGADPDMPALVVAQVAAFDGTQRAMLATA